MLSGATWSASAIVGRAVLRIVESSCSMKKATATSHGKRRLLASGVGEGGIGLVRRRKRAPHHARPCFCVVRCHDFAGGRATDRATARGDTQAERAPAGRAG